MAPPPPKQLSLVRFETRWNRILPPLLPDSGAWCLRYTSNHKSSRSFIFDFQTLVPHGCVSRHHNSCSAAHIHPPALPLSSTRHIYIPPNTHLNPSQPLSSCRRRSATKPTHPLHHTINPLRPPLPPSSSGSPSGRASASDSWVPDKTVRIILELDPVYMGRTSAKSASASDSWVHDKAAGVILVQVLVCMGRTLAKGRSCCQILNKLCATISSTIPPMNTCRPYVTKHRHSH